MTVDEIGLDQLEMVQPMSFPARSLKPIASSFCRWSDLSRNGRTLTQRGFRFDRYGFRVPAIVVSPYVKQATIDHAFYDHVSIARTLALITQRTVVPFLDSPRFAGAVDFSSVLTLSRPRKASDIHVCPSALPVAPPATTPTVNRAATAFNNLNWPMQSTYGGA